MNAAEILKTYFGYDTFRKGQEDIIASVLSGNDALQSCLRAPESLFAIKCRRCYSQVSQW